MRGRLLFALGLVVVLIGALVTARLTQLPAAPLWAVVVTAGVGLVSTIASDIVSNRLQASNATRVELVRHCLFDDAGHIPRVAAVTDLRPLGVGPAVGPSPSPSGSTPTYVARDVDRDLDEALRAGGFVIVTGPPASGQSRSLFEAVRRVYPDRLLIAPRGAAALAAILPAPVPYRRAVIWLDDLERFVGRDGLDLYTLVRRCPAGRRPGVIVATTHGPDLDPARRNVDLARDAVATARTVEVPAAWTADEVRRARAVADRDPVLAAAIAAVDARKGAEGGADLLRHIAGPEPAERAEAVALPPRPRCLGRETHIAQVVAAACDRPPRPVCVLGPPGIGKTTIVRAALHEPAVAGRFGPRRYLIRCGGPGAEAMLADIAVALGVALGPDLLGRVAAELSRAPAGLALDGLSGLWEHDPEGTETLLAALADVPGLALVCSLRGAAAPFRVQWGDHVRVPRLDHATARDLFLAVLPGQFADDPHLNELVAAQDGVPLAIELLAFTAQGEPDLTGLWRQWTVQRGGLVADGGYDRLNGSLELSIKSVRMNTASLRLLSMLGSLPDGVETTDLDELMPTTGHAAAATLRKVGLAHDERGRLRTLRPIREYVARTRPPGEADQHRLVTHYLGLAHRLGHAVGTTSGAAATARLVAESGNIDAMLERGLAGRDALDAVRAICALGEFTRYTGIGTSARLERAAIAARDAGADALEGECRYRLGDLALRRSRLPEALAHLRAALPLFVRAGDARWTAHCVKHIGDTAYELNDFDTATDHFGRAAERYAALGDRRGEANCVKCLGDVAARRGDDATARHHYETALAEFSDLSDDLGIADCLRRLADVDTETGDLDTAERRYDAAARGYDRAGAALGLANCVLGQARVALARGDLDAVTEHIQRAEPMYQRMHHARGQALCLQALGDLALARDEPDAAAEHFRIAGEMFVAIDDTIGAADCELGQSRATADPGAAGELARRALERYASVGRGRGVAQARARVTELPEPPV
jgi:tetratricopeptide (TPR) repeat protein